MATTQHRPHGALAGQPYGTLDGKTEDTGPTANPVTQHRPHGAFAGQRYGTLSGKGSSGAATISAGSATITGSTTATVGCTTDTASGTLYALARTGGTPASAATIIATGQNVAVTTTSPSISYTGLTGATAYTWDQVQVVSAVNSNVDSNATGTTDNPGGGGGEIPSIWIDLDATGASGAFSGSASSPATATLSATGALGEFSGGANSTTSAALAATGDSGAFSGAAGQDGTAALAAIGESGTFSGSAGSAATVSMAVSGGSGAFSGTAYIAGVGVYPDPATVLAGITYGPSGADYTGTFVTASAASIAAALLAAMNTTPPAVDVQLMNGAEVIGDGTESNPWRGVGVSP